MYRNTSVAMNTGVLEIACFNMESSYVEGLSSGSVCGQGFV